MKRARFKLPKTTYYRYTLDCGDITYVGVTSNPLRRFKQHDMGIGSSITRYHPPRKVLKVERLGYMTYFQATRYENALTLVGLLSDRNYRGGSWCGSKPPSPSVVRSRLKRLKPLIKTFPTVNITYKFTRTDPLINGYIKTV